jgi:adenosine deaminase
MLAGRHKNDTAQMILLPDPNASVSMHAYAQRNGLPAPYPSEEAARAAYHFEDLQSFLDLYYKGCGVLRTTRDFYVGGGFLRLYSAEQH